MTITLKHEGFWICCSRLTTDKHGKYLGEIFTDDFSERLAAVKFTGKRETLDWLKCHASEMSHEMERVA